VNKYWSGKEGLLEGVPADSKQLTHEREQEEVKAGSGLQNTTKPSKTTYNIHHTYFIQQYGST